MPSGASGWHGLTRIHYKVNILISISPKLPLPFSRLADQMDVNQITPNKTICSLGRFESLIPVANSKIGQVAKPVKFSNSGATTPFIFEGGVSKSAGMKAFHVETSLRK